MWASHGADQVEGAVNVRHPVAQGFVHRVLEGAGAGDHRDLHSFPTRRSSDLERMEQAHRVGTAADACHQAVRQAAFLGLHLDRKSTRLNSSHYQQSRMPSSA